MNLLGIMASSIHVAKVVYNCFAQTLTLLHFELEYNDLILAHLQPLLWVQRFSTPAQLGLQA